MLASSVVLLALPQVLNAPPCIEIRGTHQLQLAPGTPRACEERGEQSLRNSQVSAHLERYGSSSAFTTLRKRPSGEQYTEKAKGSERS
jgi:hypothetical protein